MPVYNSGSQWFSYNVFLDSGISARLVPLPKDAIAEVRDWLSAA